MSLFVSFLYYCVCFVMYFIVHAAFVRIKLMMMIKRELLPIEILHRGTKDFQRFVLPSL